MTPAPPEAAADLPLWEAGLPVLQDGTPSPRWAEAALSGEELLALSDPDADLAAPAPDPLPAALEAARAQADQIIAQAHRDAERFLEAARREALEALAREQQAALDAVIEALREDLQAQFLVAWETLEREAALLCASLVEPVVRQLVAADDQIVVEAVREGLGRMSGARQLEVRVSPEAVATLEAARPQLAAELPTGVAFQIAPDSSISPGGALIQSGNGALDLRIEAQVERVRLAAEALVEGGPAPGEDAPGVPSPASARAFAASPPSAPPAPSPAPSACSSSPSARPPALARSASSTPAATAPPWSVRSWGSPRSACS